MNKFIYRKICSHRLLCVCYETARWVTHKLTGFLPEKTAPWYRFDATNCRAVADPQDPYFYRISRPFYLHEHVHYDFDKALATGAVKGFAFIFFMGIGDYLYTTPLWEELKKKYPQVPFYAYVGAQFDRNNSPIVGKLLAENPHFEKVFYFKGTRHPLIWKNYDYSDALKDIPSGFLAVPVYYDYRKQVTHRVVSLFDTFGLPLPAEVPPPVMHFPSEPVPVVQEGLNTIRARMAGRKGLVFLQLDSRSSSYLYPHVNELAQGLIKQGYGVLSVTKGGPADEKNYLEIDIKKFTINQTWQLLSLLKNDFALYVIAVNSVFWAASAGLNLPNLGLQHWVDKKVHNLWYPNIEVVTNYFYPFLPREKQRMAPLESYTPHNRKIVDYKPDWVVNWFLQKFGH